MVHLLAHETKMEESRQSAVLPGKPAAGANCAEAKFAPVASRISSNSFLKNISIALLLHNTFCN
jgi:hypothetical protein